MWQILKEFVVDTSCNSIQFTERHVMTALKWQKTEYMWTTKIELIIRFNGHVWPEGMEHALKILAACKTTKAHPNFPKDPEMKMYKVLKEMVEGQMKQTEVD